VPGYLRGVRDLCTRHGILLILDEVMCGMGRTGTLHACAAEGVVPDLLTIAKGLGGGYQPIGAVLVQRAIVDSFSRGSGLFQHGHTYIGHAVACAAALAVQQVMRRDGLLAAVQQRGPACRAAAAPLRNTRMSATCAAAASSGGSNSWPTAHGKTPFDPR
jgi:adenosylmethionine-8-amino-7-oxononanoate aminotransferase